ncbi:MAG: DUF3179 domain-containing (seleno)protein, partial [Pyrinomonadaceae bacterium]
MRRWLALFLVVLVALAFVIVPVWLIQPFRPQTARALELGYELRAWSPLVNLAALLVCLALVAWMWRGTRRRWAKAAMVALLIPVFAATWFARQNHFEWMFNPLAGPAYAQAGDASFVADDDMVLAVLNKEEAVAYPVRQMAYHHLVADTV